QSLVVTPPVGPVIECSAISAFTDLEWLDGCLIGTGNLVIGLADPSDPLDPGADEIVASVPVTCLGPATVSADGCTIGQESSVSAGPVVFSPRPQDVAAGQIVIRARWEGVGHQSAVNQPQSNTREAVLSIAPCEGTFCTTAACVPGTSPGQGECVVTDVSETVCPDDLFCANVTCNETTDACDVTDDSEKCHLDPEIPDICEFCDEETDQCVVDIVLDPVCMPSRELVCRTPGFWKTHAGEEKPRSRNVTQAVLDSVGGLVVCGETIADTLVDSPSSALEAMCVSPRGSRALQLIRQLTAMGLNCAVSGVGGDCGGSMALGELWEDCNAACAGDPSPLGIGECIGLVDCFNDGGTILDGECVVDPLDDCHERDLPEELGPPGPAGSTDACKQALFSPCLIGDC
ncbi:MAG TPA: hypothetical protein VF044_09755, partial [Actinomycetota bacterium]